jgi:hypothetical protein
MDGNPAKSLIDLLGETRPGDTAGASSANRFDFQLSWALCRILELHDSGFDYGILMDFFDDVVELDSGSAPKNADFYQIKSKKSGSWTLKKLTARKDGASGSKSSILGKLVTHRKTFNPYTRLTSFVSNQTVGLSLKGHKKASDVEHYSLRDTDDAIKSEICDLVEKETGIKLDDTACAQVRFVKTPLTYIDHDNQCRGRVSAFVEKHVDPVAPSGIVYRMLRSELERRNNDERLPISGGDLINKRLFARGHLDQILALAKPKVHLSEVLAAIESNLTNEGIQFRRRSQLISSCRTVAVERFSPNNTTHSCKTHKRPLAKLLLDGLALPRPAVVRC